MLAVALALQIALAHADTGVNANTFGTKHQTHFAATVVPVAVAAAVVLRRADIEIVESIKLDIPASSDLSTDQIQIMVSWQVDVPAGTQLSRRRGAM
ncbi:hypothetical protein D3C78_1521210 [compost metagenome]